jgi:hypothetical protein
MRNRIIFSVGGALIGLAIAGPIADGFQVSRTLTFMACFIFGLGIGYVGSALVDVFTTPME